MIALRRIRGVAGNEIALVGIRRIYESSFPQDERRPWESMMDLVGNSDVFSLLAIMDQDGCLAGFITLWDLPNVKYIEHFAVDSDRRGSGLGASVLGMLDGYADGKPLLLEAELPETGDIARRRIAFYQRCGFVANHGYEYIQPPYAPGQKEVHLVLMTKGNDVDLRAAEHNLRKIVYSTR